MSEPRFNLNEEYGAISIIHACKATFKEAHDAKMEGAISNYGIPNDKQGYITDYNGYFHWIPKEELKIWYSLL